MLFARGRDHADHDRRAQKAATLFLDLFGPLAFGLQHFRQDVAEAFAASPSNTIKRQGNSLP